MDDDLIDEVINAVDIDGGGTVGEGEFFLVLKGLNRDASNRLTDLLESPMMVTKSSPETRYKPPNSGKIFFEVIDNLQIKPNFRSLTTLDQKHIAEVVRASGGEGGDLLAYASGHAKLRLNEAFNIYKSMIKDNGNKVQVLLKLLPQIADASDAKQLVLKATQVTHY